MDEPDCEYWGCPSCGCNMFGAGYGPHGMCCSKECAFVYAAELDRQEANSVTPEHMANRPW